LVLLDLGIAVRKQIYRYATPDVGQSGKLVPPQMLVEHYSMDEKGYGSRTCFRIADTP
jgi:hypothetical protein